MESQFRLLLCNVVARRSRKQRLLDLIHLLVGIVDLDVQAGLYAAISAIRSRTEMHLPVWYSTSNLRFVRSWPYTLHAGPARFKSAVSLEPSFCTLLAAYPGQLSSDPA